MTLTLKLKSAVLGILGTAVVLLVAIAPVSGHHEPAAKFDPAKPITLKGSVTKIDWLNPHVHLFIEVKDAKGVFSSWAVELESTVDLRANGWTPTTVKVGDAITVAGMPARDGSRQAWANTVTVDATNRQVFAVKNPVPPALPNPVPATPRWPDGQPRLGPPAGQNGGRWDYPSATILAEQGVTVQADRHGLLKNIADAAKIAPFQPWARDLFIYRQKNFLKDDPMFLDCKPQAGPRIYQVPYGVQFLEEKDRKRIRVIMGAGNQNWRMIDLDGRPQTGLPDGNAEDPLYFGHAVGKWEGDTLVVDSKGFHDRFWFSNGGLPHTPQLHLIERYTRADMYTLRYEVTIDDPGAYTRTWVSSWTLRWVPNEELPVYFCQDNRP